MAHTAGLEQDSSDKNIHSGKEWSTDSRFHQQHTREEAYSLLYELLREQTVVELESSNEPFARPESTRKANWTDPLSYRGKISEIRPCNDHYEITLHDVLTNPVVARGINGTPMGARRDWLSSQGTLTFRTDCISSLGIAMTRSLQPATDKFTNYEFSGGPEIIDLEDGRIVQASELLLLSRLHVVDGKPQGHRKLDFLTNESGDIHRVHVQMPISNFAEIAKLQNLRSISIYGNGPIDLEKLSELEHLEKLSLNIPLDHESWAKVGSLSSLTTLKVGSSVSKRLDITPLESLQNLRSLCLSPDPGESLDSIGALTGLERLKFEFWQSTADLSWITNNIGLKELDLGDNTFSNSQSLAELTNLEDLDTGDTVVKSMDTFSRMSSLRSLAVVCPYGVDLSPARDFKSLSKLKIRPRSTFNDSLPRRALTLLARSTIGRRYARSNSQVVRELSERGVSFTRSRF